MSKLDELRGLGTASEVAKFYGDLEGRVFLVTGCSGGIGRECASALLSAGGTVVMACRANDKARAAFDELSATAPSRLHLLDLDLGSPSSVAACARAFLALDLPLHALINSAGINGVPTWGAHTPGIETQFAVNFLGHFLLTQLLLDKLERTDGSRVVNLSSESHHRVQTLDPGAELPPPESAYDPLHAYAFSNLCRILWTRELAKRTAVPCVCLHPGVIGGTGMMQHMSLCAAARQVWLALWWELRPSNPMISAEQGARTQTWCAVAPREALANGAYLSGNPSHENYVPVKTSELAARDDLAVAVYDYAKNYFADLPDGPVVS